MACEKRYIQCHKILRWAGKEQRWRKDQKLVGGRGTSNVVGMI